MTRETRITKNIELLLAAKAQRKSLEQGIEGILDKIIADAKPGEVFEVDGELYELRDAFAGGNLTFRPAPVFRFDVVKMKGQG